jgi:hypothetical protein
LDIVDSIVTAFWQGKRDFSSPKHPIQPPAPYVSGALSAGIKRLGNEADRI